MATCEKTKVTVACIQYATPYLTANENMSVVKPLIERAQKKGAALVLLPELALHKYTWVGLEAWYTAQSLNDQQSLIMELRKLAQKLQIYIGFTFLEADQNHFYNTFILLNPTGQIENGAKVRKEYPASHESFVFKGYNNSHFIQTKEFGQIGVAICYENHLSRFENEIRSKLNNGEKISLILQPHCAMRFQPLPMFDQRVCDHCNEKLNQLPVLYAKRFGIPTMFCNKTGDMHSVVPSGIPARHFKSQFPGNSKIVDKNGDIVSEAKYNEDEGEIVIGEIELGQHKQFAQRKFALVEGPWTSMYDMPSVLRFGFVLGETVGSLGYLLSLNRRIIASQISKDYAWIPSWFVHASYAAVLGTILYKKWN